MHPYLSTLYDLQLADNHVRIARQSLQGLDRGAAHEKAILALRSEAAQTAAAHEKAETGLRQREKQLAETEQRIGRSEGRIGRGEIHNEHELESMEKEMVSLRERRAALEDEALGLMEELSSLDEKAGKLKAREQLLIGELRAVRQRATEETARLEKEIAAVTQRREALAAQVPAPLLKRYDHMREHAGGVAIVRVVSGVCEACRVGTHAITLREITNTEELVPCQGCGRYLYYE